MIQRLRNKKALFVAFIALAVLAAVAAAAAGGKKDEKTAEPPSPKLVEAVTVQPGKAGRESELSGVLQAGQETVVSFEVSGGYWRWTVPRATL